MNATVKKKKNKKKRGYPVSESAKSRDTAYGGGRVGERHSRGKGSMLQRAHKVICQQKRHLREPGPVKYA